MSASPRDLHDVNWPQWCSCGVWEIEDAVKLFCGVEPTADCSPISRELNLQLSMQQKIFYMAADAGKFLNSAGETYITGRDKYLQPLSVLDYARDCNWEVPAELLKLHERLLESTRAEATAAVISDPDDPYYSRELDLAARYQQQLPQWLEGVEARKQKQAIVAQLKKLGVKPKALLDRLAIVLNPASNKRN